MAKAWSIQHWLMMAFCVTMLSSSSAFDRRSMVTALAYKPTTQAALLDLKNTVGRNPNNRSWGATWIAGRACSTWAYTTCDPSTGTLLSLVLEDKFLEGVIPTSFYSITTLTKLDLSGNRLYGSVRRDLAVLNQGLVYLDLSSNFFTGYFPDLWSSPDIYAPNFNDFPYSIVWGNPQNIPMFINISNTFFSGFQTINVTTPNFGGAGGDWPYYSFQCIGIQLAGSVNNSCFSRRGDYLDQVTEGSCTPYPNDDPKVPASYRVPVPRDDDACAFWCGSNTNGDLQPSSVCQYRPGAHCVPTFANSSSNVVNSTRCVYVGTPPPPPPPPPVSLAIDTADAAALRTVINALNLSSPQAASLTPYRANPLGSCTSLPRISCSSSGRIVGLDLSGLQIQSVIPLAISGLRMLRSLNLARNRFFNTWPFDLAAQLPDLERLDLNTNLLVGAVPSGFLYPPVFVNISNNYFSGSPLIQQKKPPQQYTTFTYCPADGRGFLGLNCLATSTNTPCAPETQRTPAQCLSFCGIQQFGSGFGPIAACGNGQATCLSSGQCNGTVTPVRNSGSKQNPIQVQSLAFFKEFYVNYGTPASVFSTWEQGKPCNGTWWQGLTCNEKNNVIAVDLRGKGLRGPFPGPSIFQELFWPSKGKVSDVRYVDLSNNQLYGNMDPMLSIVTDLEYLDLSNNFLTGNMTRSFLSPFRFLNLSNNYLVGSPILRGLSNTRLCPGTGFLGSVDNNCFDILPTSSDPKCTRNPVMRTATACRAYCRNGARTGTRACPLDARGRPQVCKPAASRPGVFECALK